MRLYTLLAAAKINLYLEILGDRCDGFHELVMVMQSISLADRVTVRGLNMPMIQLRCDHPQVPTDATNLAYRAAMLLQEKFPDVANKSGGVEITIDKRIPVGAGLAGGSSNGAAALVGLNLLWDLGLTQMELQELGAELGSDVPFCVMGGTAIATGRGEELDPLTGLDSLWVVLAKFETLSVATPWAYKSYRQQFHPTYISVSDQSTLAERQARIHSGPMVSAISAKDGAAIGRHLYNDLEKVVLPTHPEVSQLRDAMAAYGGLGTLMTGSGPTIFTLAETQTEAEVIQTQVRSQLAHPSLKFWVAQFSPTGIRLVD